MLELVVEAECVGEEAVYEKGERYMSNQRETNGKFVTKNPPPEKTDPYCSSPIRRKCNNPILGKFCCLDCHIDKCVQVIRLILFVDSVC